MTSTCLLELGKTRYRYETASVEEKGTIVFIHGMTYPLEVWQPIQDTLSDNGWCSLSYDLHGRGESEFNARTLGLEELSNQLFLLLRELRLESPVHLVSLSNGDWIALDFVARY